MQIIALVEHNYFTQVARHGLRVALEMLGNVRHQTRALDLLVAQGARHLGVHFTHVAVCYVSRELCLREVLVTVDAKDVQLFAIACVQNQFIVLVIAHVRDFVREIGCSRSPQQLIGLQ